MGYSNADAYQFNISITERNLRGRGQFLRFSVNASSRTQNVDIRFNEPRFLGRNIGAGFELFSIGQDFLREAGFETQSTGVGLRVAFPLAEDRNMGLRYTYRRDEVEIQGIDCTTITVLNASQCDSVGDFTTSLLGATFNWDRRNDPIRPTRGFDLFVSADIAGLGTGVQYGRAEFGGGVYRGFAPDWVGSLQLTAGYVDGYGGDKIRLSDRFFKGGTTFRGFEVAGIGPRRIIAQRPLAIDDSGNPILGPDGEFTYQGDDAVDIRFADALGGKAYAIATAELTIPTPLPESYGVRSALFVDIGTLGLLDEEDLVSGDAGPGLFVTARDGLALRGSAGLSVFWTSPFGPIRFDFSYPFLREEYDRTETFRFSQTTQF